MSREILQEEGGTVMELISTLKTVVSESVITAADSIQKLSGDWL